MKEFATKQIRNANNKIRVFSDLCYLWLHGHVVIETNSSPTIDNAIIKTNGSFLVDNLSFWKRFLQFSPDFLTFMNVFHSVIHVARVSCMHTGFSSFVYIVVAIKVLVIRVYEVGQLWIELSFIDSYLYMTDS